MEIIVTAAIKKIKEKQPSKKILRASDIFSDIWDFIPHNSEKQRLGKILYDEVLNNLNRYPDIKEVGKYSNSTAYYKI